MDIIPTINWPPHKAGMALEHNTHKDYYETLKTAVHNDCLGLYPDDAFISPDDKALCIANDDIWTLTWCEETPVGYYRKHASTFEKLMAYVNGLYSKTEDVPEDVPDDIHLPLKKFMIHWHDGRTEFIYGETIRDAYQRAGYSIRKSALDWWEEVTE